MVKMEDSEHVCPLCCEELDISDRQFYPCKCGYQVCMWCWHRIRESETGLCPACRTPYGDDPHQFSAVDVEEVLRANKEKEAAAKRERQQQQQGDNPHGADNGLAMEVPKDRSQLANMRVIRRNLVYAVGLPPAIATEDILRKPEYFGQYGKIAKIVINRTNATTAPATDARRASASAYVTFQHKEDTLACILALDGFYLENRNIRASYGTSKYCSAFIKNVRCNNPDCTYLHEMGAAEDTFTKQEIQAGYVTSGRDVLARQQQIVAEQLRLQQLAAGGSGHAAHTAPRKRVGGGGPSGTGKSCAHPAFPPPEYDEPAKPSPPLVPPPSGLARSASTTAAPTVAPASLNPATIAAKMGRSASIGAGVGVVSRAPAATVGTTTTIAAVPAIPAPAPHRKTQSGGLPATTTAASVVAAGRKETADSGHSALTALTPLKRTSVTKAGSTPGSTKATTAARSSSSSPPRSSSTDEKMPSLPTLRNGKKQNTARTALGSTGAPQDPETSINAIDIPPSTIGGDVIGPAPLTAIGSSAGAIGPGRIDSNADPVIGPPSGGTHNNTGLSFLGGLPIELTSTRGAPPPGSLSSELGGEIFNGPLYNNYQPKSAIGSGSDKWNQSNVVGGSALTPNNVNSNYGSANNNGLWPGNSAPSGSSGVIGGQRRISPNQASSNSTSALASLLGINLPTGSGSLQDNTSSLWSTPAPQHQGPSPISTLNGTSMNANSGGGNMMMMGGSSGFNSHGGSSLIGGIPIGGIGSSGFHAPGAIGGGGNKSDIALLQSLLPGVHITTDGSNPMMGFGGSGGWNHAPGHSQQGLGGGSLEGSLGGDPIHSGNNWIGGGIAPPGAHGGSAVGAVGQNTGQQNQRQQGPGIW